MIGRTKSNIVKVMLFCNVFLFFPLLYPGATFAKAVAPVSLTNLPSRPSLMLVDSYALAVAALQLTAKTSWQVL